MVSIKSNQIELAIPNKEKAVSSEVAFSNEDIGGGISAPVGLGEGQTLISSPVRKKRADEAYSNDGSFDVDQELTVSILADDGIDITKYVTPDNSPEQMFELGNAVKLGLPEDKIFRMAEPQVSYMALQVIVKAWKAGIDLTEYLPWADPLVLNQAFLAAKGGLDLSKIIKPGLDHRQIEQLRKQLEEGKNPDELSGNYNQMRSQRFPDSDISNKKSHTQKGFGVSTHNKRRV